MIGVFSKLVAGTLTVAVLGTVMTGDVAFVVLAFSAVAVCTRLPCRNEKTGPA